MVMFPLRRIATIGPANSSKLDNQTISTCTSNSYFFMAFLSVCDAAEQSVHQVSQVLVRQLRLTFSIASKSSVLMPTIGVCNVSSMYFIMS